MAKTFQKRTKSTQRNSGVTSGFQNDYIHVVGVQNQYQVTPAGGYCLHTMSINAIGSGTVQLMIGSDIILNTATARDYKIPGYLYDKLLVTTTDAATDITFCISKG